eukprot:2828126-Pleurochrysis_carterae.AAC.2
MQHRVGPKGGGSVACDQVRACQLHYGADCPLRDPVQLMHVRRTRGSVHAVGGEEVIELARQKLARIVTMKSAHDAGGS